LVARQAVYELWSDFAVVVNQGRHNVAEKINGAYLVSTLYR